MNKYKERASEVLPEEVVTYINGSTGGQNEVNEAGYKSYMLRPHLIADVSKVNLTSSILGHPVDFPMCIAPMGGLHYINSGAELVTASAAAKEEIGYTMSSWSSTTIEDLVYHCPGGFKLLNIYIYSNRSWTIQLIQRAERAGFHGLVVGFARSTPQTGASNTNKLDHRRANIAHLVADDSPHEVNLCDLALTWEDLSWLKSVTSLPVIVKGVLRANDAKDALYHGADALLVSNHGGRQLESGLSTIDCLSEVIGAVDGRCEVYIDGGLRSGVDLFKALALGARAVFVGRPILWGLAHSGMDGIRDVIKTFKQELEATMIKTGANDVNSIPKDIVVHKNMIGRL